MRQVIPYFVALAVSIMSLCCLAQEESSTNFAIPYIEQTIAVDGELQEPHWQKAQQITLDYVTRPFENTKPPVETRVYLYEDGKNLYVAFEALDPNPDAIRAFYRDRDKTWGQDLVGIKIDTFNNSRLAYQFFMNALGVQADSIQNELTGDESDSWDAIWQSKGVIHDAGFTTEMVIPLRLLAFNSSEDDKTWRMELIRFYPRKDTYRIANRRIDRNNSCDLCQMGEVTGFARATHGQNIAVVPAMVLGRARNRDLYEDTGWGYSDNQEVGLDLSWSINPEVSLQATLNPDFSQVEADVAQLSINNPYSLYFKEKRPFFVENADYFSSNYNLVYTRNIGAPDVGAKITGRVNQHTFGVFVANDESTAFLIPGNIGSRNAHLAQESNNAALRYRYDLSKQFSLGFITTLREADNYHN